MENIKDINSGITKSFLFFAGIAIVIFWCVNSTPFAFFGGMHDANAGVQTWLDLNGDGKQDSSKPILPNVCVWAGYANEFSSWDEICGSEYSLTDSSGRWTEFFAGGNCNQIYIAAKPPQSYRPTTLLIVNDCSAKFGFVPSNSISESLSPDADQYLQQASEKRQRTNLLNAGVATVSLLSLIGFIYFKVVRSKQ